MDQQQEAATRSEQEQEYRPCIQDGEQRIFDSSLQGGVGAEQFMSIDQCEMDDSQLVGAPATVAADADVVGKEEHVNHVVDVAVNNDAKVAETSMAKRKRGRPPKIGPKPAAPPPAVAAQRKKKDEEDVCFICFDGGSLVLCDRRGCPKAYHPACIKRDESFFRSKAKWNCGWHICGRCQKASHYMCYTCTYSLCKGCTKDADYVCVRGNKGFCGTCLRTIMLIENIATGNNETVQVDFDDKTSWEYLFKVYWIYLKAKLSLTVDELTKAKNPWKGDELIKARNSWRGAVTVALKGESSGELDHGNDKKGLCSDNCCGNLEANDSKRRKTKNQPKFLNDENCLGTEKLSLDKVTTLPEGTAWATKELLELVAHMRNGDISVMSQFDVQALLLEYIKRNNLRDPLQKCQIVCDSRLMNLFGKARMGHIEMLKLLEYHYLMKEKSPVDDIVRMGVADAVNSQVESSGNNDGQVMRSNDRRRKTRKRMVERGPQIKHNPDEYAAIDVHNINLLYLKRSLMENLMDDAEKFHENVVGSFVRIRISSGDQKQDIHRLVQVVGTSRVAESYKVDTKTTDVMLEILNLDKKEIVSIDVISNQEFLEDECQRLRQCMKCGLIKHLTVGEIQEKAKMLQAVKVSDWLEAEILRLNHLRDRASEKGRRKELRECVEKLELLKSPNERQRRLLEIPNVNADPHMDPSYESGEDAGEPGGSARPRNFVIGSKRGELNSPLRGGDTLNGTGNKAQKIASEQNRNITATLHVDRDGTMQVHDRLSESTWSQGGESFGLSSQNTPKSQVGPTGSVTGNWNSQTVVRPESFLGVASAIPPPPLSTEREQSANDIEADKLWHYQDPAGKIQGPFAMVQLRKWSTSGLFPLDLRVWRINEKQDDSILLTDALVGKFHKEPQLPCESHLLRQEVAVAFTNADNKSESGFNQSTDASCVDSKKVDNSWKVAQSDSSNGNNSSSCITTMDVNIANDGQTQNSIQGWDLFKVGKLLADQHQMSTSHPLLPSFGKVCETPSIRVRESQVEDKWSLALSNVNGNSHKTTEVQTNIEEIDEKRADSDGSSSQSSGQNWKPPSMNDSSSGWDSNSGFVSVAKPIETSKQNQEIDFSHLPDSSPKQSLEDLKGQAAENKQSVSSNVPVLDSGPGTASSLVADGAQIPEVAGQWGGYSPATAKASVEEWDSNIVPASSLKPTEGASDHAATPTSGSGPLTHSSPPPTAIDASSWEPIVPEPNEFDESVSDLLAEIEAMECLGGLPFPTSKMRCAEFAQGSDNGCFSHVEAFSPAADPGRSDALSSTSDIPMPSTLTVANELLRLSHMPSQPTATDEPLQAPKMPSQLVTDEPLRVSHMPSQSTVTDELLGLSQMPSHSASTVEPLGVSQMPSQSTITDEPLGLSRTDVLDHQKSLSGHSSTIAEGGGGSKPSDVSVNQWEAGSETRHPASTVNQGEAASDIQPPTPSTVGQWDAVSDIQHPAASTTDANWGTSKENANLGLGRVAQGNIGMVWGTGHGTVQQHASMNSTASTGILGSWGGQPRYGGDRYSGSRDHRNYFPGRDSGFSRDGRSSWNRQPLYGAGSGSSFRPPPKGQRVCKFYESGHCKKGASCSYWHP